VKVVIGSDHGGFTLKEIVKQHLVAQGHAVDDIGCSSPDPVDYPDFAKEVAIRVADGRSQLGVMIDGAGVGSAMAANKINGIRAACCNDLYSAANSREHNHANVLTMGSMIVGPGVARKIVDVFVGTQPAEGRHANRVQKIMALERLGREQGDTVPEADIRKIVSSVLERLLPQKPGTQLVSHPDASPKRSTMANGVLTEQNVRDYVKRGERELEISRKVIVTPLARDTARDLQFKLLQE